MSDTFPCALSSGSGFWWAGGPIELDVSIAGDHDILDTPCRDRVSDLIVGRPARARDVGNCGRQMAVWRDVEA